MTTLVLTRSRSSRWSLLAILAATAVGLSLYSYLSWLRAQVPVSGPMVPMVVAARDIDAGWVIDASMLKVVQFPGRYLPLGAFSRTDTVIGKVAAFAVLQTEPVTERKVGRTGGASSVVPPGMRAYSLSAQTTAGLAITPRSGDRVDVILTLAGQQGEAITRTILRSARVASIQPEAPPARVTGALGLPSSGKKGAVTVLVTPEQAEGLAYAESAGKLAVVLAPSVAEPAP